MNSWYYGLIGMLYFNWLGLPAQDISSIDNDSLVYWYDRKLTWEDFKVKQGSPQYYKGIAMTAYDVSYFFLHTDGTLEYDVRAYFIKSQSWVMGVKSKELLAHEQLHFDIAELYARRIRKEILDQFRKGTDDDQVEKIVKSLLDEIGAEQEEYDIRTFNGSLADTQRRWKDRITESLNELKDFSSPSAKVDLEEL